MGSRCIAKECLGNTGFSYTLSLINGKYKMTILCTLMEFEIVRFSCSHGIGIIFLKLPHGACRSGMLPESMLWTRPNRAGASPRCPL